MRICACCEAEVGPRSCIPARRPASLLQAVTLPASSAIGSIPIAVGIAKNACTKFGLGMSLVVSSNIDYAGGPARAGSDSRICESRVLMSLHQMVDDICPDTAERRQKGPSSQLLV